MDSSVWIDFFNRAPGPGGRELRRLIEESEPLAVTGIVIAEVLQGLKRDVERVERALRSWDMLEPRGFETYLNAASLIRLARSRGTALTTVDAFVATLSLEQRAVLFTLDGDFRRISSLTGLRLHPFPAGDQP